MFTFLSKPQKPGCLGSAHLMLALKITSLSQEWQKMHGYWHCIPVALLLQGNSGPWQYPRNSQDYASEAPMV